MELTKEENNILNEILKLEKSETIKLLNIIELNDKKSLTEYLDKINNIIKKLIKDINKSGM